jgi:hypothetical protein
MCDDKHVFDLRIFIIKFRTGCQNQIKDCQKLTGTKMAAAAESKKQPMLAAQNKNDSGCRRTLIEQLKQQRSHNCSAMFLFHRSNDTFLTWACS